MKAFDFMNRLPSFTSERLRQRRAAQPTTGIDPQSSTCDRDHQTEPTQSPNEERMDSWIVRNRKRLAYESMFINQTHQLDESQTTTTGPAVYPHALAIRLAKRGMIGSVEKGNFDHDERCPSVSGLEDGMKVETSSFV